MADSEWSGEVSELPLCGDAGTIAAITQLYGRQSHLIDSGRAEGWAETFVEDGIFDSPTYPAPVAGRAALTQFARDFLVRAAEAGEVRRHVVNNLVVAEQPDPTGATGARGARRRTWVEAYISIAAAPVGTSRWSSRLTVVRDELTATGEGWRIVRRQVHRDDAR